MNKEEILAMEAGGDLDALVAKEITEECYHIHWTEDGKDSIECLKCGQSRFYHQHSQNYSTDISAAWQVVKKMISDGYSYFLNYADNKQWGITYAHTIGDLVSANTVEEAICKAALLAKYSVENNNEI